MHRLLLPVVVSVIGLPSLAAAQDCDRDCLGEVMTRFLDSLVAHDPSIAPLADDVRMTEDTIETPIGQGFWATATELGAYRNDFLDVRGQTAAVQAVMAEGDTPVLFAARLKVENREITEIETMVVRGPGEAMLFNLDNLQQPSKAFTTMPPKDQLMSREDIIDMAMRYPDGLRVGSFNTSGADFSDEAYRFENGQLMGGPGCSFIPGCDDIQNQGLPVLSDMKGHPVAVDEQNGTVLLRLDFGPGSVMGGGGGGGRGGRGAAPGGRGAAPGGRGAAPGGRGAAPGGRGAAPGGRGAAPGGRGAAPGGRGAAPGAPGGEAPAPQVLVTFEGFKIYGGEIHAVEAVFESMPANSPTGWE